MKAGELNQVKVMQLASSVDGQPWICTVYFVVKNGNFFWLSFPDRRHSREVAKNEKAAAAIVIHQDVPVVGVQVEGSVHIVGDIEEATGVLALYIEKYGKGKDFVRRLERGENQHELYCLVPRKIMLFDERTRPDAPYDQINLID
jgi:uncharacterized protein YhbP (UPF0306 family)